MVALSRLEVLWLLGFDAVLWGVALLVGGVVGGIIAVAALALVAMLVTPYILEGWTAADDEEW